LKIRRQGAPRRRTRRGFEGKGRPAAGRPLKKRVRAVGGSFVKLKNMRKFLGAADQDQNLAKGAA
jgi:hypothetical protein